MLYESIILKPHSAEHLGDVATQSEKFGSFANFPMVDSNGVGDIAAGAKYKDSPFGSARHVGTLTVRDRGAEPIIPMKMFLALET